MINLAWIQIFSRRETEKSSFHTVGENNVQKSDKGINSRKCPKSGLIQIGRVNDDEQKIYGAFRSIRFRSQVASIVTAYQTLYKKDLLTTLKQRLSQNEMNEIVNIIETKPLGITK